MTTHWGWSNVSLFITNSTDPRPAAITFGVNSEGKNASDVWTAVTQSLSGATSIKSKISSQCAFSRCRVTHGTDGGDDIIFDQAFSQACTGALDVMPPNVALLVHKRTARGGRRGRGRFFIPWILPDTYVAPNGVIDATHLASLNTSFNVWFTELNTRGTPMALLPQPSDLSSTPTPINLTSLSCDPLVSTQRRRLHR
jgi:hypothetical protein